MGPQVDAICVRCRDSHDQIKGLHDKARAVHEELGPSGADYFITQCVKKVQRGLVDNSSAISAFETEEKIYLKKKLNAIELSHQGRDALTDKAQMSPKVQMLINFLREEDSKDFSGLVFVKTRAEVAVLSHLLSNQIPSFQISTFVGASSFSGRKAAISELVDVKNQKTTLDDLRHGRKNLIVTTNALEEGIDVSRCKLVVCFDRPPNLKSFIQRRGRARKSDSKFVIMFEDGSPAEFTATWTALEAEMREIYMDEMRQLQEIQDEEDSLEDVPPEQKPLIVKSTGYFFRWPPAILYITYVAQGKTYTR